MIEQPATDATSRVLLVEGTSGVGKSTLLDSLVRRYVADQPVRKLRTLLHLTQAHTFGPLAARDDRGTLTVRDNVRHLDQVSSLLDWHVNAVVGESKVKFFALIDTLHLTQCHRPGLMSWPDVRETDTRLALMGIRMVFLRANDETLWRRGIEPRVNEPFMQRYAIPKFGSTVEKVHAHFVDEQRRMQMLLDHTSIPHIVLDAEADDAATVEQSLQFWLDS